MATMYFLEIIFGASLVVCFLETGATIAMRTLSINQDHKETTASQTVSTLPLDTTEISGKCNVGEFQLSGYSYWFKIDWWGTYSYYTAEKKCRETNSVVADIFSEEQYNDIAAQIRRKIPHDWVHVILWTALKSRPTTGVVTLSDGQPAPFVKLRPDGFHPFFWETHIGMTVFKEAGNRWEGMKTFQPTFRGHGFICIRPLGGYQKTTKSGEITVQTEWGSDNEPATLTTTQSTADNGRKCTVGEFNISSGYYWFEIDWWNTYSYHVAVKKCNATNSVVADILSEEQYNLVAAEIRQKIPSDWEHVMMWTALKSNPSNGVVTLSDDDPAPFVKWQPDEPSRTVGETNIIMTVFKSAGNENEGMEDFPPSYRGHGFVCQRQRKDTQETTTATTPSLQTEMSKDKHDYEEATASPTVSTSPPVTTEISGKCNVGEFQLSGYSYWFKIDLWGTYSYYTAEKKCRETNSVVADIFSEKEYNDIAAEIRRKIPNDWVHVILWTALKSPPTAGVVTLSDGRPAPFVKWRPDGIYRAFWNTRIAVTVFKEAGNIWEGMKTFQPTFRGHGFICQRPLGRYQETTRARQPPVQTEQENGNDPATPTATAQRRADNGRKCTVGEFHISSGDYWFEIDWWNTYSYSVAVKKCNATNSVVADILSEEQYNLIAAEIRRKIPSDWEHVMMWTALQSNATTGVVTLSNGNPAPFVKWQPDEPNRSLQETNIIMTVFRSAGNAWEGMEDFPPSYRGHGFVCRSIN